MERRASQKHYVNGDMRYNMGRPAGHVVLPTRQRSLHDWAGWRTGMNAHIAGVMSRNQREAYMVDRSSPHPGIAQNMTSGQYQNGIPVIKLGFTDPNQMQRFEHETNTERNYPLTDENKFLYGIPRVPAKQTASGNKHLIMNYTDNLNRLEELTSVSQISDKDERDPPSARTQQYYQSAPDLPGMQAYRAQHQGPPLIYGPPQNGYNGAMYGPMWGARAGHPMPIQRTNRHHTRVHRHSSKGPKRHTSRATTHKKWD